MRRFPSPSSHPRARRLAVAVIAALPALSLVPDASTATAAIPTVRPIVFPVDGPNHYSDTYGACRGTDCERSHEGQDIMAAKTTPLVAAANGTVGWLRSDSTGLSGNALSITDAAGWRYVYIHINNDSPGTDDGANPARWRFAPGIEVGANVRAGQLVAWVGDSGNAESTSPHLHFEIRRPDGVAINPYESLVNASRSAQPPRLYVVHQLKANSTALTRSWARAGASVLLCDVDGDGADEPVQRVGNAFYWRTDLGGNAVNRALGYGNATDVPVCGDWNGDGIDTFGVFRNGSWYLRNRTSGSGTDVTATLGIAAGDRPVVGDWNGDGVDGIGIVRSGTWYLRNTPSGRNAYVFSYGAATDLPVAGDWNGDGVDTPGIRRGNENRLRNNLTSGRASIAYTSGAAGDLPIAADVDRDGDDALSIWRPPAA
jgi:hypothetical protein